MMTMGKRLSVRPKGGLRAQAQSAKPQDAPETRDRAKRQTRGDLLQVSRHGERRARQRVGLPKRAVGRNAQRALTEGIGYREASGALRRYISWLYELYDGNGNNIRIYNGYVYVFHDALLITVLFVPLEYRKAAMYQQKRWRNEHG